MPAQRAGGRAQQRPWPKTRPEPSPRLHARASQTSARKWGAWTRGLTRAPTWTTCSRWWPWNTPERRRGPRTTRFKQ
eukprot:4802674-Lingulodinium_polyedra.AAC.1